MKKLLALVLTLCMVMGVMSALAEGFTPARRLHPCCVLRRRRT